MPGQTCNQTLNYLIKSYPTYTLQCKCVNKTKKYYVHNNQQQEWYCGWNAKKLRTIKRTGGRRSSETWERPCSRYQQEKRLLSQLSHNTTWSAPHSKNMNGRAQFAPLLDCCLHLSLQSRTIMIILQFVYAYSTSDKYVCIWVNSVD